MIRSVKWLTKHHPWLMVGMALWGFFLIETAIFTVVPVKETMKDPLRIWMAVCAVGAGVGWIVALWYFIGASLAIQSWMVRYKLETGEDIQSEGLKTSVPWSFGWPGTYPGTK